LNTDITEKNTTNKQEDSDKQDTKAGKPALTSTPKK